jgi:hypothetical protein
MENEIKELFTFADALCARIHTHRSAFQELVADMRSKFDVTRKWCRSRTSLRRLRPVATTSMDRGERVVHEQ